MDFIPITLEQRPWLEGLRSFENDASTAYSFPSLLTWQSTLRLTVAGDDRFFVVRNSVTGEYFQPCGNPDAVHEFIQSLVNTDQPFRMIHITEPLAQWLGKQGYSVKEERDDHEYIYRWNTVAHPTRSHGHAIKIKIVKFSKLYDYRVSPVTDNDSHTRLETLQRWVEGHDETADAQAAEEAIRHFSELDMYGILLRTQAGNAFCLGYPNTHDEFTIAFVKTDPALAQDATVVCLHELARALEGHWSTINLEEDCGLPGLRDMKMHLHPSSFLKLYSFTYPPLVP